MKEWVKKHYFASTAALACLVGLVLVLMFWRFMVQYEEGVLEVCAEGQDAYVQLVLDQIYIRDNRTDASIIEEILGSLDASTNKYWTFSKEETMLFVKDVSETNKYKGFTTATYYISESATEFLQNLRLNSVTHGRITIEDRRYVASGVIFEYNGSEYRLCLLSNEEVFLDNNAFLGGRINISLCYALAVVLMVVGAMLFAHRIGKLRAEILEKEGMMVELNASIAKLNEKLLVKATYDMRRTLFQESMLPVFLDRITQKNVCPVSFVLLNCANEKIFLEQAQVMLDRSVLRFRLTGDQAYTDTAVSGQILLIFLNCDRKRAFAHLRPLITISVTVRTIEEWRPEQGDIHKFLENMRDKNQ
ncbi:MAG: hypothetical protein J6N53_07730 [Lachnospiraceae bacterium]|nr:hypothetical protein [Lachnospiraceae bacterium]